MRTVEIKKKIQDAVADEQRNGRLRKAFEESARQRGIPSTQEDLQKAVGFVQGYIELVPLFLEQGASTAQQLGLGAEMGQMLQELEQYWFEENDLMADRLGLLGLMDDAYASLLLLQSLSDYCQVTFKRPLLQQNLTAANQSMRALIGDPPVSMLEQKVGVAVANAMMQRIMSQVATAGFSFPTTPNSTYWERAQDYDTKALIDARIESARPSVIW
ncbi:MAG: hypothetical protein JST85_26750 [Acidobacteria bacterium]|nr:hypothetical protein [Acidobacteriota bacterium]